MTTTVKCNKCWKRVDEEQNMYATKCQHFIPFEKGRSCAEEEFTKAMICPCCDTALVSRDIKQIDTHLHIQDNISDEQLISMVGYTPEKVMQIANHAIQFWSLQKEYIYKQSYIASRKISQELQEAHKKNDETQKTLSSEIQRLSNERTNMLSEMETCQRDLAEIKKKYTEKSREYDRLKDLYNNVRTKATASSDSSNVTSSPNIDSEKRSYTMRAVGDTSKPKSPLERAFLQVNPEAKPVSPSFLSSGSASSASSSKSMFARSISERTNNTTNTNGNNLTSSGNTLPLKRNSGFLVGDPKPLIYTPPVKRARTPIFLKKA